MKVPQVLLRTELLIIGRGIKSSLSISEKKGIFQNISFAKVRQIENLPHSSNKVPVQMNYREQERSTFKQIKVRMP